MLAFDWNNIVLLVIALLQTYNTYLVRRTEKNTNSMKDALVVSTAKENFTAGRDVERAKSEAAVAALTKGMLLGAGGPVIPLASADQPIPVADNRTATATERTATASERVASAAERTADEAAKKE